MPKCQLHIKSLIPKLHFSKFNGKWSKKMIRDVTSVVGGRIPSTTNEKYWNGDANWFTPTEVKDKYVMLSNRKISKLGLEKSSAILLPVGTILLTTRATIGKVSIPKEKCTTNQYFKSLIVNESNSNQFVFNLIKIIKNKLCKNVNDSAFSEISKKEVEKIEVIIPKLQEQQKITLVSSQIKQNQEFKKSCCSSCLCELIKNKASFLTN